MKPARLRPFVAGLAGNESEAPLHDALDRRAPATTQRRGPARPGANAVRPYLPGGGATQEVGPDPVQQLEAIRGTLRAQAEQLKAEQSRLHATAERIAASLVRLDEATQQASATLAEDAVAIGMLVAEQLVGHAVASDATTVRTLVQRALQEAPDEPGTRVRLSPDDVPRVEMALAGTKRAALEVVADPQLAPGDCLVESKQVVVDARLAARLAGIRGALEASLGPIASPGTHDDVELPEGDGVGGLDAVEAADFAGPGMESVSA